MAASAADVRSILSIQPTASSSGPSQPKKTPVTARKPEGISRELYSLIGPSAPSLAAQLAKPRLKQKPNLGGGGKVKWEWRPFKNGARNDGLELGHWVKATSDPNADYQFAKYSVKSSSYTYTDDEYTLLEAEGWTKEETDYLFGIVGEYDLRWYVIHDRYDFPGGAPRALEDLKDRYFSVCRKLVRNRLWEGDEQSRTQLLSSLQFDRERETTRKQYISSLENRTPEQIAEEEALYIEVKRLEQSERRFRKERDDLLRTLAGADSGLPDLPVDEDGLNFGNGSFNMGANGGGSLFDRKKKKGYFDMDSPSTPSNIIALGPPVVKRPQAARNPAQDALHCITRTDPPATPMPVTKGPHPAAHLRSFKLPVPKASVAPKVAQVLAEIGVQHTRLVIPTRDNLLQLESLLEATYQLLDIKKLVDRTNQEIRVVKSRLQLRASEAPEAKNGDDADMDADAEVGSPMDLDAEGSADRDAEGEVDEERAPSVVSTRSRKNTQRSMSTSSVDTSATVSTRATKRQKRL